MIKTGLCGLDPDEILSLIGSSGYTGAHALKISNGIYKKRARDFNQIKGIPGKLIAELHQMAESGISSPAGSEFSTDGTIKYLFINSAGLRYETVYLPDTKRKTVCVSSQSGCRMGCPFCATGNYGFHGSLSAGEIVSQVLGIPEANAIDHVVFMGMGEPMDNLASVLKACEILTSEWGVSLSPRNITVSTVGITQGIRDFLAASDCNLTVSLFSPFPEERKKIVPAENKDPVSGMINLLKNINLKKKRRISLSYVMIAGVNDTDAHLDEIIRLLKGSQIRINLLPYHPAVVQGYEPSSAERMYMFKHNLVISGISASVRKSRGSDISAACGLLASGMVKG